MTCLDFCTQLQHFLFSSGSPKIMSGAEAVAVVSIIANVLQLVEFSSEALARVKNFTGDATRVPKAFQRILIVS